VSSNLALISHDDEFTLVQTPTTVTDRALAVAGNVDAAVAVYERYLRDERVWEHDADGACWCWACWMSYAPGWSWDPVTRHVAMVNAFVAFAPGARFYRT